MIMLYAGVVHLYLHFLHEVLISKYYLALVLFYIG